MTTKESAGRFGFKRAPSAMGMPTVLGANTASAEAFGDKAFTDSHGQKPALRGSLF